MEDQDRFAVWIAQAVLLANEEEFTSEALAALARKAELEGSLDAALKAATSNQRRPGDMGLDIVGPVLAMILVEFGRMLWKAYAQSLVEQGGKALAEATITTMKNLARRTWSGQHEGVSLDEVERLLREAAGRAKLDGTETERLVRSLRSAEATQSVVDG